VPVQIPSRKFLSTYLPVAVAETTLPQSAVMYINYLPLAFCHLKFPPLFLPTYLPVGVAETTLSQEQVLFINYLPPVFFFSPYVFPFAKFPLSFPSLLEEQLSCVVCSFFLAGPCRGRHRGDVCRAPSEEAVTPEDTNNNNKRSP